MRGASTNQLRRLRRAALWGVLRVFGPVMMMGGLWLLVDGLSNYIGTLADIHGPTLHWGKPVAGLALLLVGGVITIMSRVGRWGRYAAESDQLNEPVLIDPAELPCPRCLHINEPGVHLCSGCGSPLAAGRPCPHCRHENDADGKICDNCGQALGA